MNKNKKTNLNNISVIPRGRETHDNENEKDLVNIVNDIGM